MFHMYIYFYTFMCVCIFNDKKVLAVHSSVCITAAHGDGSPTAVDLHAARLFSLHRQREICILLLHFVSSSRSEEPLEDQHLSMCLKLAQTDRRYPKCSL